MDKIVILIMTVIIVGLGIEYANMNQHLQESEIKCQKLTQECIELKTENNRLGNNVINLNQQKWELFDRVQELQE